MTDFLAHQQTLHKINQFLAEPTHALGLSGDAGAGKGFAAQYIAAQLLQTTIPKILQHPYVLNLDASAQKTGIDDIRELQKFLTLTVPGTASIKRVVIVQHLDTLGHEAQNALLKTLEEPPVDTVILVTFKRDTALLPTIHSRMQRIQVVPVDEPTAAAQLNQYSKEEFTKAYYISGGLSGLLIALLTQQADHPLLDGIAQARQLIGSSRYERLAQVDKLVKNSSLAPAVVLDGLYRLIDASYRQALKSKPNQELRAIVARLRLVEQAISDLEANVQAKLVFSRLFAEL
ncbi:MAG: hypothetical protein ACR2FM_02945 [Candidatus Saccharimonadales bacterium]